MTPDQPPDAFSKPAGPPRAPRRVPILAKMLLLVTLCTLVPLAGLAILSIQRGYRAVELAARRNLELVAQVTATQLDQLFSDLSRMQGAQASQDVFVQFCQGDGASRPALHAKAQQRMQAVLASNPDLCMMFLADCDGVCCLSTSDGMIGGRYKEIREYMRQALAGTQYVSDMAMGTTTGEAGVFFSGPIRDEGGKIVGVTVLKLRGSVVDRVCRDVSEHVKNGFATVIDSRDVIISHPDASMLYHSLGTLSESALAGFSPKLQYGVEKIESLGLDGVLAELRRSQSQGSVTFTGSDGAARVAGYARMKQRPWKVSVMQPEAEFDQPLRALARQEGLALAAVGLVCVLIAMGVAHRLVRPIRSLTRAGRQAAQGDWSARAEVTTHDELADLARTFNDMMPKLRERSAMENALRLANDIQQNLLPHGPPHVSGLDVAGTNIPADHTGGDYYDFLDLSAWQDGTLAIAVGDVSGHGVPAALLMTTARALLRSRATPPGTLVELMTDVNRRLCDDTPAGRFMTLMYAVIDRNNRRVSLVSAGHDPIIFLDPATGEFRDLTGEDIPLGIDSVRRFSERQFDNLPDGAVLFFGTDGVWESSNVQGELFGKERLRDVLRASACLSAAEITQAVVAELTRFRGQSRQEDDVTVVTVKVVAC